MLTKEPSRCADADAEDGAALCSIVSARLGLALIGSAGCYDRIVAFELAAPWTSRIVGSRSSDAALDAAIVRIGSEAKDLRLLAVEPRGGDADTGLVRVLVMERGGGAFREYARREFRVPRAELAASLEGIAFGAAPERWEIADAGPRRDILVCTHGSRDACCGKFGYPVYRELAALAGESGAVRIWRCSHLGGHRFAPTLLDLPSGRMFGRLVPADARAILGGGRALLERVAAIYRGRVVLPEAAQVVERDLWLQTGAVFESAALTWKVEEAAGEWAVEIEADAPAAATHARVVRASAEAVTAPASCGRDPESEAPWQIVAEGQS